jgi:radical SAM enzyme (TIGR01210 family)
VLDPTEPRAVSLETERSESGAIASVLTVFLVNRECPWRCLMCDLWRDTLEQEAPEGLVAGQVDRALARHPGIRRVKLYNAGNFFDERAVSPGDRDRIAGRLAGFERVVVESHPSLVGSSCFDFARRIPPGSLEVAMGLETAHPQVLEKLNKRMTVETFASAARRLLERGIGLRTFVLVGLPFLAPAESLEWTRRSVELAFDSGSRVVSLIPTRSGNGAMDALERSGEFCPPTLAMLEASAEYAVRLSRGLAFADLWDVERLRNCDACFPARKARLERINLSQTVPPPIVCGGCGEGT